MEKLVPRLRFSGFEGNWERKKLGEITKWASGGTPPKDNEIYWNGNIPWISASTMRGLEYSDSPLKLTDAGVKKGSKIAKEDSLLLLVRGSMLFNKIPIGRVSRDVAFNQDVKSIEVNKVYSSSDYILSWITANENMLLDMVTGTGIGAGKLDLDDLKNLVIALPPKDEQKQISLFLTAVQEKLVNLKKKKALLEKYKKGLMQKIFNQEVRFKDEDGKDFGEWEEKKLENICDFFRGSALSKSDLTVDGINFCIHYGELFTKYNEVINNVISKTNISGFRSELGDILMPSSDVTPVGLAKASSIQLPDIILGGDVNVLRPHKVESRFLSYLLNFSYSKIIEIVSGTTVKHIYNKDLKKLKFKIPEGTIEQANIADFLSAIDDKIDLVLKEVEKMEVWKKGLLGEMFV